MLMPQDMVPVPAGLRITLIQQFGVSPHMPVYFRREEPSRVYVYAYGQMHFIDLPVDAAPLADYLMQFGVDGGPQREASGEMGTTVQNLALKACELAGDDLEVQNDLESQLNKVVERVLSKLSEKRNKNGVVQPKEASRRPRPSQSEWQTLTDAEREQLQRERRKNNAYKTSLCKAYREDKTCPYGEACCFAHGEKELRLPPQAHPKYKTQLCNKFSIWGYCPYGARCQFIHQRANEFRTSGNPTKKNSGSGRKAPLSMDAPSQLKRRIVEQMNTNSGFTNSPVALGNHSSLAGKSGFCSSLTYTDFAKARNQTQSKESADSSGCEDGSFLVVGRIAGCEDRSHPEGRPSDRSYLDELNERLSNMKIAGNSSMFSKSCSARISSCNAE